jgi:hypothetical protein
LGHRRYVVDSTLLSQTNLQAAVALFYLTPTPVGPPGTLHKTIDTT